MEEREDTPVSEPESEPYPPLTHFSMERGLRMGRSRGGGLRDAEEDEEQKRRTSSWSLKRTDLSLPRLLPGGLARSSERGLAEEGLAEGGLGGGGTSLE